MVSYGFHSEAADEYLAATRYYLDHASPLVAAAFVAEIESRHSDSASVSDHLANNRRASNSTLPAQTISVFTLLSMGTGAGKGFNICNHALQQTTWLLASSLVIS